MDNDIFLYDDYIIFLNKMIMDLFNSDIAQQRK